MPDYKEYLLEAINLARSASQRDDHPCGTVIVDTEGQVLSASGNKVFSTPDVTAHAEMLCLRAGSNVLLDKNTPGKYILFSSLEPCCGCAFYIARTNIKKVVYAATDSYKPGISMLKADPEFQNYFKDIELIAEPFTELRDDALILMRDFFIKKGKPDTAKFYEPISINRII